MGVRFESSLFPFPFPYLGSPLIVLFFLLYLDSSLCFFHFIVFLSVCGECEHAYQGDCPIHENIIPIPDTPTTSYSLPNPSVASLPPGTVVRQSTIQHAGLGVFTTCWFQRGSTFGPYGGVRLRADVPKDCFDTSYIWEVRVGICRSEVISGLSGTVLRL